jgi:hypothetical protein
MCIGSRPIVLFQKLATKVEHISIDLVAEMQEFNVDKALAVCLSSLDWV